MYRGQRQNGGGKENILAKQFAKRTEDPKIDRVRIPNMFGISSNLTVIIIMIIMVILKCYFSGEHIALSIIKKQQRCEHRIRKDQKIKSTVHDAN